MNISMREFKLLTDAVLDVGIAHNGVVKAYRHLAEVMVGICGYDVGEVYEESKEEEGQN